MTTGGWIFMIIAWGAILALAIFCYTKIILDKDNEPDERTNGDDIKVY